MGLLCVGALVCVSGLMLATQPASANRMKPEAAEAAALLEKAATAGTVRVIVGLKVAAQPPGNLKDPEGVLALSRGLKPVPSDDGRGMWFKDPAGATVLRYGGLYAFGATGRGFPARLAFADDLLRRVARRDQPLSPTALKYRLREHFNDQISFCGPPVGVMHVDRSKRYRQFTDIMAKLEEFHAILGHNNLPYTGPWSDLHKQLVIREHNILSAIRLDGVGEKFDFHLRVPKSETSGLTIKEPIEPVGPHIPTNAFTIEGSIDQNGVINISKTEPLYHMCPQ